MSNFVLQENVNPFIQEQLRKYVIKVSDPYVIINNDIKKFLNFYYPLLEHQSNKLLPVVDIFAIQKSVNKFETALNNPSITTKEFNKLAQEFFEKFKHYQYPVERITIIRKGNRFIIIRNGVIMLLTLLALLFLLKLVLEKRYPYLLKNLQYKKLLRKFKRLLIRLRIIKPKMGSQLIIFLENYVIPYNYMIGDIDS